ncbi:DUF6326 family protein [Salinispirillum marinum]|uniref:DUF6326 family protein n=2 Tax=Saccharospirillaceae TaxID=255527 RepID=A0ABV8BK67_9GAMM
MNSPNTSRSDQDRPVNPRIVLATLWTTLLMLYLYADVLSLYVPGHLNEMIDGYMGPIVASQTSLMLAAVLMTLPSLMIVLSLVLSYTANRRSQIGLGALYTLVNVGNVIGEDWLYYLFFGAVEVVLTVSIVVYAVRWRVGKH